MLKKITSLFRAPSAETLALKELDEAKRELLVAVRHAEYYASMVRYHQMRISRLGQTPCVAKRD